MDIISADVWKKDMQEFREIAEKYYTGELSRAEFKSTAGKFGVVTQKGDVPKCMLRMRLPGGRLTLKKMAFIADMINKYHIDKIKFSTCQNIQLHNLDYEPLCDIMEKALDVGIISIGAGGDNPRNVTASPLSGLDPEEYFDVLPYTEVATQYALHFVHEEKMPRKLKIGFSSSPKNINHATMRDLGFVARPNGKFDVYSAGGIGPNPKIGVRVAEAVELKDILQYIRAMWLMFRTYGNYKMRARARSRYMQETLGGPEKYREAFQEKLAEAAGYDDYTFELPEERVIIRRGRKAIDVPWAIPQKQEGLYSLVWHPIGGFPNPTLFCRLSNILQGFNCAEVRVALDGSAYIINLTGREADYVYKRVIEKDTAKNQFELSSACVGSSICQVSIRDSQAILRACIEAVQEAKLPYDALPAISITGCPSSCATPELAVIGLRGGMRDKRVAWMLYVNGCELQGQEAFGKIVGAIFEEDVPKFFVELGKTVAESQLSFADWHAQHPDGIEKIAEKYI